MNWEQLLSLKRFGDTQKRIRAQQDETLSLIHISEPTRPY